MLKRMTMASLTWVLGVSLLGWTAAPAQQQYYWTVSASPVDPCVSSGNFAVGGIASLFLWYYHNNPDGLSAADFSVVSSPGAVNVLAFNTANGFLNAGSATGLLLAVGGCPNGPVNAGSFLVLPVQPVWELCLGGNRLSVDCQINPVAWPSQVRGYTNGGATPTCLDFSCPLEPEQCFTWSCDPETGECIAEPCPCDGECIGPEICDTCKVVSIESSSWGKVKTLYR